MNKLLFCFLSAFIFFYSCKEDEPTSPQENQQQIIANENIGFSGGTIEAESIVLEVPPGAFAAESEIIIRQTNEEQLFEHNLVSEIFLIEGLPSEFRGHLNFRIKYNKELGDGNCIFINEELFVPTLNEYQSGSNLFPASESAGFLICEIESPLNNNSPAGSGLFIYDQSGSDGSLKIGAVSNVKETNSSGGHFIKRVATRFASQLESKYEQVLSKLETYYELLEDEYGLKNERVSWPVQVNFLDDANYEIRFKSSFRTKRFINVDAEYLAAFDVESLKGSLYREFVYLVVDSYDWREDAVKYFDPTPEHYWLNIAVADPGSQSTETYFQNFTENGLMAPFNGFQKGAVNGGYFHGRGMAFVLGYLIASYNSKIIGRIYDQIKNRKHPVEAIMLNTDNTSAWVHEFFKFYFQSSLFYKYIGEFWRTKMFEEFTMSKGSSEIVIPGDYPDLSAKWYRINLTDDFKNKSKLSFNLEGGSSGKNKIILLKFNDNDVEFLEEGESQVSLANINDLADYGWNLFVLVTNSDYSVPYTNSKSMTLKIKVDESEFNPNNAECMLHNFKSIIKTVYPDGNEYFDDEWLSFLPFDDYENFTFSNNRYFESWDYTGVNTDIRRTGSLEIVLNPDGMSCNFKLDYSFTESFVHFYETIVTTVSLHGQNIPLTSSSDNSLLASRQFLADGEDLANYITKLEYKAEYGGESPKIEILDSHEFTSTSSLVIYLREWK